MHRLKDPSVWTHLSKSAVPEARERHAGRTVGRVASFDTKSSTQASLAHPPPKTRLPEAPMHHTESWYALALGEAGAEAANTVMLLLQQFSPVSGVLPIAKSETSPRDTGSSFAET